jgi:uncharacterized membrane protein YgaE (UPF0421/DUF939 family)
MSDTTQIIVTVIGTGVALLAVLVAFRQEVRTDIAGLRQEMAALRQELRTDIAALHNRIDNLYQALFSRKDPAA